MSSSSKRRWDDQGVLSDLLSQLEEPSISWFSFDLGEDFERKLCQDILRGDLWDPWDNCVHDRGRWILFVAVLVFCRVVLALVVVGVCRFLLGVGWVRRGVPFCLTAGVGRGRRLGEDAFVALLPVMVPHRSIWV